MRIVLVVAFFGKTIIALKNVNVKQKYKPKTEMYDILEYWVV